MSFIKKNGLNHFLEKIERYRVGISETNVPELVGRETVNIVVDKYNSTNVKPINVTKEINGSKVEVVAYGEKLAFAEFGTGITGKKGLYPETNLPDKSTKLVFESPKGVQQSTDGWEYNYRAEQAKQKGIQIKDFVGFEPQKQMLDSSIKIKEEMPSIIKKAINKRSLNKTR